jgi:protocatechuate 3,4-dioxygenase alpha subunit
VLVPTSSQTVGPFFSFALHHEHWNNLLAHDPPGEQIRISGRLIDGDGAPVADGFVEIRQANTHGVYAADPEFPGFGRCATDASGEYRFTTIRPGRVLCARGSQAPHIAVQIFARGLLRALSTRMYFGDRAENNAVDPLLSAVDPARRHTLVATRVPSPDAIPTFRFDIVLQGDGETAFFVP